jgi:hypothetical protein
MLLNRADRSGLAGEMARRNARFVIPTPDICLARKVGGF